MASVDGGMKAYCLQGLEQDRLSDAKGALEFERTTEILQRRLPGAPALIADVGGGPGRYAMWLSELGYTVEHRDVMALHVEQLGAKNPAGVRTAEGDARALDLADGSVDAVLLLGPLYHLPARADRVQAQREARRVVRPGGPVFVAVISRWAARLDGVLAEKLYEKHPSILEMLAGVERSGDLPPVTPAGFTGYTHRPQDAVAEIAEAGLELDDLVGVEGLPLATDELRTRRDDPVAWRVVLDSARALERVPELLGLSGHLIASTHSPLRRR